MTGSASDAPTAPTAPAPASKRLPILLAMAMFVLVVDTSLMNVSISAVVHDLDTTVSGVQSAIALEALVSAAFILIGSKIGDLFGRKRAYVLGLLGYAVGALSMALAQNLLTIVICWAIIGGLGASLLLPAMQSLIHGNFEGDAQRQVYALVGAAAAIAAAVGPLIGGFITTYLSWRVAFLGEAVVIAVVLSGIGLVRDVEYTGDRARRHRRRGAVGPRHGRDRPRHPRVGGGRRSRRRPHGCRRGRLAALAWWLVRRKRAGKPALIDPDLFKSKHFRLGISGQMPAADRPRRGDDRAADLPADGARVQRDAGRPVARPAVAEHVRPGADGRQEGRATAAPPNIILAGFALLLVGLVAVVPVVPQADVGLVPGGAADRRRLGARPPRVPAEQLHAVADLGGAGQRGRRSELGRRFVRPLVRPGLRRRDHARARCRWSSPTWPTTARCSRPPQQEQVADALEDDAELMSNTQLAEQLEGQPARVQAEILEINHDARPMALQIALLVPIGAALIGLVQALRMRRLPDLEPCGAASRACSSTDVDDAAHPFVGGAATTRECHRCDDRSPDP